MPKGPRGQKRPADTVAAAIKTAKILTGEIEEDFGNSGKDKAAQSLGRRGGAARREKLSPERRAEIARKAAAKRWGTEGTGLARSGGDRRSRLSTNSRHLLAMASGGQCRRRCRLAEVSLVQCSPAERLMRTSQIIYQSKNSPRLRFCSMSLAAGRR